MLGFIVIFFLRLIGRLRFAVRRFRVGRPGPPGLRRNSTWIRCKWDTSDEPFRAFRKPRLSDHAETPRLVLAYCVGGFIPCIRTPSGRIQRRLIWKILSSYW